jgi:AcrR family transcriptional regulator
MARPTLHTSDQILDAARTVVLTDGAPGATIGAISRMSRAPAGSIYHRFGSRDVVLVELWMRAVKRSQGRFLAAIEAGSGPFESITAAGLSIIDFAVTDHDDARLLCSLRFEDLVRSPLSDPLNARLRRLNRPVAVAVAELARQLGGEHVAARELVMLAAFDLPYGAVRRHLNADAPLPTSLRANVEVAIRAVLEAAARPGGGPSFDRLSTETR